MGRLKAGIDHKKVMIKGKRKFGNELVLERGYLFNLRVHSLRKYFKTACSMMGVDRMASEAMMGHSLITFGIENVYDYCVANRKFLRTQYELVLPLVTFLVEPPSVKTILNSKARKEIEVLREENLELKKLVKALSQDVEVFKSTFFGYMKLNEECLQRKIGKGVKTWSEAMKTKKWKKLTRGKK